MNTTLHEHRSVLRDRAHPDCRDPEHRGCSSCDGRLEEREAALCNEFITSALRDVKAVATFAQPYTAYNTATRSHYQRRPTVAEIMSESLDYPNGPEFDDLMQLLADAARGEDIRPKALALVQRMGAKYAQMNVVVEL